jgi:hypothetical protein
MNINQKQNIIKYFAAANSYNGFVSFFDTIFNSSKFNRVYILKGGPGTGKSSFMKNVSSFFKDNCVIEEIYCSSDPESLDGIIVESNGKRIAVLDGTAPHERDAVIPGAIDEIINLGDSWDDQWLMAKREKILKLSSEKKKAYKSGYNYLSIAGSAENIILKEYDENFDRDGAKIKAESFLRDIPLQDNQEIYTKLLSAFGRHGYFKIEVDDRDNIIKICINGDEFASIIFINQLRQIALAKGLSYTEIKYPLNPSLIEALHFTGRRIVISNAISGDFNSTDLLINYKIVSERTRNAKEMRKEALLEAQRWFSIASELHFELEKIYGEAMNFEKNDEILYKKIQEMKNILQI